MLGYRRLSCVLAILVLPALTWADTNTELYKSYQRLLTDYVVEQAMPGNGLISAFDYRSALADSGLQKNLADQQAKLQEFDPATLNGQEESVAFWINAYNFFMLAQILTERPDGELVSSVWDYGGRVNPFVDNVFERKSFAIGGREYSLNEIEKDILLGDDYADMGWKDARVHFAVNCASVGCPPLRDTLYTADNLEDMLAENTRRALSTERHLRVEGEVLYLTELFKWYAEDFTEVSGSEKAFIEEWADPIVVDRVAGTGSIEFIDYDWTLNSPANFSELR